MSREKVALVLGCLILGMLVGCGNGADVAGGPAPVARAKFIARADAICRYRNHQVKQDLADLVVRSAQVRWKFARTATLSAFHSEAEELGNLEVRFGRLAGFDAILERFEKGIEEIEDSPAVRGVARTDAIEEANSLSAKIGLRKCMAQ